MFIFWLFIFVLSLALLIKGADWLIKVAEKIGLALGLSPFIVGVTIVAVGTSLPELISSFFATLKGVSDVAVANTVGSNIFNILAIVGIATIVGKRLTVTKSLIDLDLPLLAASTILLLGVVWDKQVTLGEAILLVVTYGFYLLYTVWSKEKAPEGKEVVKEKLSRPKLLPKDFMLLLASVLGLFFGAKYLVEALIHLSSILNLAPGIITVTAVAIGTSLPELIVSVKAALQKKSEIALGNIFGSNIFNALVVVGLPGLFRVLTVDAQTFLIGLPFMALATLLFVFSGISKRIHVWEGIFYLSLYVLFIAKIFNLF